MDHLMEVLAPVLGALLSILIPATVALIVRLFQKAGIEVEAQHRDTLQTTLRNAALLSIGMGMGNAGRQAAIEYVRHGAGDAVRRFALTDEDIESKLAPHVTAAKLTARQPVTKMDAALAQDVAAVSAALHGGVIGGTNGGPS